MPLIRLAGAHTPRGWRAPFGTLTSRGNCEVERTRLGATFTGQPWNGTLEPGAMTELGYCVEYAF